MISDVKPIIYIYIYTGGPERYTYIAQHYHQTQSSGQGLAMATSEVWKMEKCYCFKYLFIYSYVEA